MKSTRAIRQFAPLWLALLLPLGWSLRPPHLSAETVVSRPTDGFDLHNAGLVYWRRGDCGSELIGPGRVSYLPDAGSRLEYSLEACSVLGPGLGSAAVSGSLLYFFNNNRLSQKSWAGSASPVALENASGGPLAQIPAGFEALVAVSSGNDPYCYWVVPGPGESSVVQRARLTASPLLAENVYSVQGSVERLIPFYYTNSSGGVLNALLVLTRDGTLSSTVIGGRFGRILERGVTDVHVRVVPRTDGAARATIYASKGIRQGVGTLPPPGSVVRIDALSGESVFAFQCQGSDQALSVTTDRPKLLIPGAIDRGNVYVTVGRVTCGGSIFQTCDISSTTIQRGALPGRATTTWDTIHMGTRAVGRNLRSDGEWLYYQDDSDRGGNIDSIGRLPADITPLQFNLRADHLEVTQAIQTTDGRVPLVAGREGTYVRGFARFSSNRDEVRLRATAQVRAWNNGVEIEGSPFQPIKSPLLRESVDLEPRRDDVEKSYLFLLPPLEPGTLRVEFLVDPHQAFTEVNGNGLPDNRLSQDLTVLAGGTPCLTFIFPRLGGLAYSFRYLEIHDVIDRAKALLPVSDFDTTWHGVDLSSDVVDAFTAIDVPLDPNDVEGRQAACDQTRTAHAKLLDELALIRECSWDPLPWCAEEFWVGAIHPGTPLLCSTGMSRGIGTFTVRMTDRLSNDPVPWRYPRGGVTLAHELGHEYGRAHVACGMPERPDPLYPYGDCMIGANVSTLNYGFDSISRLVIEPDKAGDVMSYAGNSWTSDYTWLAILDESRRRGGIAQAVAGLTEEYLLVQGSVDLLGPTGSLDTSWLFPLQSVDPDRIEQSLQAARDAALDPSHAAELVLVDARGQALDRTDILLRHGEDESGFETSFLQYVPFDPDTRRIELRRDGRTLAVRELSASPPRLLLDGVDVESSVLTSSWRADDLDGDEVSFNVLYSPDDGATWSALAVDYEGFAYAVSTSRLSGSSRARLRIDASDGIHTTSALSQPFVVPENPPEPYIGGLSEASLPFGTPATLEALVIDPDRGSRPFSMTWQLEGPVSRADVEGDSLSLDGLPPGDYLVRLRVLDAGGLDADVERRFEIAPLLVEEASAPPRFDGQGNDATYEDSTGFSFGPDGSAFAWFARTEDTLYVALSALPYSLIGAPVGLTMLVDANGSGEDTLGAGDFGINISSDGRLDVLQRVGGQLLEDPAPHPGVDGIVVKGPSSWSAELRVPASLLGNWSPGSRIGFWLRQTRQYFWPDGATSMRPSSWAAVAYSEDRPAGPNRAPSASAGDDQVINAAESVLVPLDAAGSLDPDGDELSYSWTQVSGPAVSILAADSEQARFSVSAREVTVVYRFRVTVSDSQLESADEVSVVVVPVPDRSEPIDVGGQPFFVRGDVNVNGDLDISDASVVFNWLFLGSADPACVKSSDANDDSSVDITDGIYLLSFLFLGGPQPPAPFPGCGVDPSADGLSCDRFTLCP